MEFFLNFVTFFKTGLNQELNFFKSIYDGSIDWIINIFNGFLSGIGDIFGSWLIEQGITIEFPPSVFNLLNEITIGIGYILPIVQLMPIVYCLLSFYVAKIIFAIYQLIASTVIKRIKVKV